MSQLHIGKPTSFKLRNPAFPTPKTSTLETRKEAETTLRSLEVSTSRLYSVYGPVGQAATDSHLLSTVALHRVLAATEWVTAM